MAVAAGSQESVPQEPVLCTPTASPTASSPDRPSLHLREQSSSMKNRKRENCTSGTVRDEDGNILIYSANDREDRENVGIIRSPVRASILPDYKMYDGCNANIGAIFSSDFFEAGAQLNFATFLIYINNFSLY
jgi:hypothetical protein